MYNGLFMFQSENRLTQQVTVFSKNKYQAKHQHELTI